MKRMLTTKLLACGSALLLLFACNKEEGVIGNQPKAGSFHFSLSAEADGLSLDGAMVSQIEDEIHAMTYDYEAVVGKDYPKPVLKFKDKQEIPVVVVIQKKGQPNSKIIAQTNWIYEAPQLPAGAAPRDPNAYVSGGRVYIKGSTITGTAPQAPAVGEEGWKMLCIVGGKLENKKGKQVITFANSTPNAINASDDQADQRSIETIYMNEEWADLTVGKNEQTNVHTFSTSERIRLKNQTVMFMLSATGRFTKKQVPLRGFRIASDNLAFEGQYNLTDLTFNQKPAFENYSYVAYIRPPRKSDGTRQLQWLSNKQKSHLYVAVGIPIGRTSVNKEEVEVDGERVVNYNSVPVDVQVDVSPLIGDRYEVEAKVKQYRKKQVSHGSFVSIDGVPVYQRDLILPIESFMFDEETGILFREPNIDYNNALDQHSWNGVQAIGEGGRYFQMPNENHLRILFPNMHEGESLTNAGVGSVPILNMGKPNNDWSDWDTSVDKGWVIPRNIQPETIEAFEEAPYDYHAQYKLPKGEVAGAKPAYGLRFKGNGNKYLAAYRYAVVNKDGAKMMEIRVRELGPKRAGTTINQIANETYWATPAAWDQREVVRYMAPGRYWSSTAYNRAFTPSPGAASVAKVLLEGNEDGQTTYAYGAFVTDGSRRSWCENPRVRSNQVNSGYTLITRNKKGVQSGAGAP